VFLSLIGSDERQVFKNALGERGGLTFGDVFAIDRAARFMVSEILAVAVHDPTKPTADFHRIIPPCPRSNLRSSRQDSIGNCTESPPERPADFTIPYYLERPDRRLLSAVDVYQIPKFASPAAGIELDLRGPPVSAPRTTPEDRRPCHCFECGGAVL
jgi:hypothetical protein